MSTAYGEAVRDAVALREHVLEHRKPVGERCAKPVRPIPLPLTSKRWRRGVEISPIARSEELLDDIRSPTASHSFEKTTDQRLVRFCCHGIPEPFQPEQRRRYAERLRE